MTRYPGRDHPARKGEGMTQSLKDEFEDWWRGICLKGDPLHQPNLVRDAFVAGAQAVMKRYDAAIIEFEKLRP